MDFEQKYYDLLYENKSLKNEIKILSDELYMFRVNKKNIAAVMPFIKQIHKLNSIINCLYIFNEKIICSDVKEKEKEIAINNLKIMEEKNERRFK